MRHLGTVLLMLCLYTVAAAQSDDPCATLAAPGTDPAFYLGLGDVYFAQEDYGQAIAAYSCAIEGNPDYAPAYVNRGYAYVVQLNMELALEDYNRALELDESLDTAYNNRGVFYTNQGNFGLAINDFTLAIALNPDNSAALNNRGIVHAIEGNFELALADIQAAIALAPDNPRPHASLGTVYLALAAASYSEYQTLAGDNVPLPGGDAESMLTALLDSLQTGSFGQWLPLQAAGQ